MGKMQKTSPASGSCSTSTDVQEDRKPITLMKLMNSHPHRYQGVFSFEFTNKFELKSQSEPSMPDSPDSNSKSQTSTSPGAMPLSNAQAQGIRAVPAPPVNGMHSPSSVNGAPSPPNGVSTSSSQQQLPPACGARQLSKLKRFLTTLQQFGSDISPEIGERVRGLVMGLVNSQLSIEEFHQKLQEATNFPLRPFVIPFLKANLPLLQRELLHCARMAKQTPAQYLSQNEHILLNTDTSPVDSSDIIMDVNENGKRRTPDSHSYRPKENGVEPMDDPRHPAKRHCTVSPGQHRVSPGTSAPHPTLHGHHPLPPPHHQGEGYMRDMPHHPRESRDHRDPRDPRDIRSGSGSGQQSNRDHDREHFEGRYPVHPRLPYDPREYERGSHRMYDSHHPNGSWEDEWKHVEQMLHCVAGMVDKTLRAIASLRHRSVQEREEMLMWSRRCAEGADHEMKKRAGEMMAHTIRQTEDRVSEVKRRAEMYQAQMARTFPFYNRPRPEEAVNEVKRQAVIELQKAVAAAEQKASELVAAERAKMERAVADARRQAQDEANQQQESSSENCWNCGRKASETCSGCNVARYCGSFCQHKDWENHHRICGTQALQQQAAAGTDAAAATTSATTPPTVASPVESVKSVTTTTSRSGSPVEKAEAR
ncbi:protein CBFA2T1-like isoform X4 [Branchiostoma floridae]|uniref:Protein CBFA2T1-like isoform X4 n=2 Tax=Branchiostoma floridae TaxID=7739 RepID=A0A9J7LC28_BRAFL|nr:protein CBFA2T1-like isoform X4 [Branchiostoma floridae]